MKRIITLAIAIGTTLSLLAETASRIRPITLDEAITLARVQSVNAAVALNELKTAYWEYRTFKADLLPEVNFSATLPSYAKSYNSYQQSDGSYTFVRNNYLQMSGEISIDQNIWFTGGTLSLNSALDFMKQLDGTIYERYMSVPVALTLNQPIFGTNTFKWDRRIEPVRYAEAKANFLSETDLNPISIDKEFDVRFIDNYSTNEIYYSDFGALGDGVTDDFTALYNTHAFANTAGKKVFADAGATYYIQNTSIVATNEATASVKSINIQTETDWGDASFIIDDSILNYRSSSDRTQATTDVFKISSPYESTIISGNDIRVTSLGSVGASYGTTKIDLGLGYSALLIIYNDDHKVYRRSGSSSSSSATTGYSASARASRRT